MRTNRGFTLLEILVALAIFSSAILTLGRMQIAAGRASNAAERLSHATALAQDKAEQLLALAYTDTSLADPTPKLQYTTYVDAAPPAGYTITWQVDADNPVTGVKTVNITVAWKNRTQAKSFTLAFYKES